MYSIHLFKYCVYTVSLRSTISVVLLLQFHDQGNEFAVLTHDPGQNGGKITDNISKYNFVNHDDVIKWKHFPRYWPFVRGIHR